MTEWAPVTLGREADQSVAADGKPVELSLRIRGPERRRRPPDRLREALDSASDRGANLLLVAELDPDGSMDLQDEDDSG